MRRKSLQDAICPMARALDTIGDWWSLLIIRDAMLGVRRFSDFQTNLGLAGNILSARLKKLVACDIMEQVPAANGSAYQEYALTKKGRTLLPVVVALRQWGEDHLFASGETCLQIVDKRKRKPLRRIQIQDADGKMITAKDLDVVTVN
jgi:DNA-binding HxlR family transcriptional regulator